MDIDKKLSHLSEEEIQEVVNMYLDKSNKITDIIKKFDIDVYPSGLLNILPPRRTEQTCKYCGEYLYSKLEARTSYSYGCEKDDLFCLACGHNEYSNSGWRSRECECEGCRKIELLKYEKKREVIRKRYGKNHNKIDFEELSLWDKVILVYVLLNNNSQNTFRIAPMRHEGNWVEYLNRLREIGAISVSPESDIEAFCDDGNFPNSYYVRSVCYDVNVRFKDETIYSINNNNYFVENNSVEDLIDLLKLYIYDDLMYNFQGMLKERRLDIHISDNANDKFIELIDKISYTQILALCKRVAVFFSDKVITGSMSRYKANNAVLINVSKFYERAIESNWTLHHEDFAEDKIGLELKFFIEKILNKNISILKDVASADNFSTWENYKKSYNNTIGHYDDLEQM